jgi:hypothetical protein
VLVAFVVGVMGVYAYNLVSGRATDTMDASVASATTSGVTRHTPSRTGVTASDPTDRVDAESGAGEAAPTPDGAVTRFLDAEVASDFAASYRSLSASNRVLSGSAAQWVADHDTIPPFVSYRIRSVAVSGARAEVGADLALRPSLDQVRGLVPAHASGAFIAVAEDGGWRLAWSDSVLTPRYPADDLAPEAVVRWADDRRACRRGPEYAGGLLGAPRLVAGLCGARRAVAVDRARLLPERAAAEPFLAAFGPSAHQWLRAVRVRAPVRVDVVVAPLGEHWLVVGVLAAH